MPEGPFDYEEWEGFEQKGKIQTEVIVSCSVDGCINKGKIVIIAVRELDGKFLFYVHHHANPICEHIWEQAKKDLDYEVEEIVERKREWSQSKWCPHCGKRIPETSTTCPECGGATD